MKCKNCKTQGELAVLFEGIQINVYKAIKMAGNRGAFRHIPSVRIDKIPITKKPQLHLLRGSFNTKIYRNNEVFRSRLRGEYC